MKIETKEGKVDRRLDEVMTSLPDLSLTEVQLNSTSSQTVWVVTFRGEISQVERVQTFAVILNTPTLTEVTRVNYLMTNVARESGAYEWIVTTNSQRICLENLYRDVKEQLGFREYQVRDENSMYRHFILVFVAYTLILWHKLTGGLRRQWTDKSLTTFVNALEAFRIVIFDRLTQ